jgi:hypothetical protein
LLQDAVLPDSRAASPRRAFVILAFGLAGVLLICGVYGYLRWREIRAAREGLQLMRQLTVDQLIVRCGMPQADEFSYSTGIVDGEFRSVPTGRTIMYRYGSDWNRLTFAPQRDGQWHLRFYASPIIGVPADAENAYLAVADMPCMRPHEDRVAKLAEILRSLSSR